jgi:predicted AAA+ superfamily ATPase
MVDSGLMASQLSWKTDQVRLDSDRSGKLIETFAFNEIAAQVDAGEGRYELFHYRDREKREIDFLIEREDNALLGIEKQKFIGIVLYTGEFPASFGDNLWAVPFGLLWS